VLSNLSETDIRLLRVFAKVVESKGFSAAQITLNVNQSTISTHMQALEQRLGIRLCERGRSGFALTERGQMIYQASQKLFAAIEDFRSEAGVARNCLVGTLTVGIIDCLIGNPACVLSDVIRKFNDHAPEVQVNIRVTGPSEIERLVLDGHCDVGLGACGRHSPYLAYDDLFEERQTLFCGKLHPLFADASNVSLADLKDNKLIRRAYAAPEHLPADAWIGSAATADLMESVALLVLSGRYIGFLPYHYAAPWVQSGDMRALLDSEVSYDNPIYLVLRKVEIQKPVVRAFTEELLKTQAALRVAA